MRNSPCHNQSRETLTLTHEETMSLEGDGYGFSVVSSVDDMHSKRSSIVICDIRTS